jgi:hypothetical protein
MLSLGRSCLFSFGWWLVVTTMTSLFLFVAEASPNNHGGNAARRQIASMAADNEGKNDPYGRAMQHRFLEQDSGILFNSSSSTALQLRQDLLEGYDRGIFPWEWAWNNQANNDEEGDNNVRLGLPVQCELVFHKVFAVEVDRSLMDLVVWFRQSWVDPRLQWDPADYGNMTMTWFTVQGGSGPEGETSEIWTPDLELWNKDISLKESLTDTQVVVSYDGSVFWSRPGHLRPACKFEGLDDFPFDELSCKMEIGSWSHSGLYIRPIFLNDGPGYAIGGSETAGESYAEFSLGAVETELYTYPPFPIAPEEDFPVIFYTVTFSRAWQPYARGYILLQILICLIAFCCFWMPPHVGERYVHATIL